MEGRLDHRTVNMNKGGYKTKIGNAVIGENLGGI